MVTNSAMQLHGGNGYTTEQQVERHWRNARLTTIFEGTSEISRRRPAGQARHRRRRRMIREPVNARKSAGGYSCLFFDATDAPSSSPRRSTSASNQEVSNGESRPKFISHVVFNTVDLHKTVNCTATSSIQDLRLVETFCFMRTGKWHHLIAFARSSMTSLNHCHSSFGLDSS